MLIAALASLNATQSAAENAPEKVVLAFKQLHYQDYQKSMKRIKADAPSVFLQVPVGEHWSVDASAVMDLVSGASPRYYSAVSGASHMDDKRKAYNAKISHYQSRSAYSASYSRSNEHDYLSNAVSLDARFSTEDNNTTFNVGVGAASDKINPVNEIVVDEKKDTYQFITGVTHALTPSDLLQAQLGYSSGKGYYSDPYKTAENRPDTRRQETAVARWNHHFEGAGASLRSIYRFYNDSWKVQAHTLTFEWAQPLGEKVTLTPALSYYTQSSAKFYIDPAPDGSLPIVSESMYSSLDQRLSAFGAVSGGATLDWHISESWSADLKGEYYHQRSDWRLGGDGSPGIDRFSYYAIQVGLSYSF